MELVESIGESLELYQSLIDIFLLEALSPGALPIVSKAVSVGPREQEVSTITSSYSSNTFDDVCMV
jgi:hypothetical protein